MITQMERPAAFWVEAWESMQFRNFLCLPATTQQSTEKHPAVWSTLLRALGRIVFMAVLMSSCGTARSTPEIFSMVPRFLHSSATNLEARLVDPSLRAVRFSLPTTKAFDNQRVSRISLLYRPLLHELGCYVRSHKAHQTLAQPLSCRLARIQMLTA